MAWARAHPPAAIVVMVATAPVDTARAPSAAKVAPPVAIPATTVSTATEIPSLVVCICVTKGGG